MTSNIDGNRKREDKGRDIHLQTGKYAWWFINTDVTYQRAPALSSDKATHWLNLALTISSHCSRPQQLRKKGPTIVKWKHQLGKPRGHQLHAK